MNRTLLFLVFLAILFNACDKGEFEPKSIGDYPDTLVVNYYPGQSNLFDDCIYPHKVVALNLHIDSAIAYQWIDNYSTQPVRYISYEGNYDLQVTYSNTIDTLHFSILSCNPRVYAPTSFTPNGDFKNDEWFPVWNYIESMHWEIRTEDGIKIFETDDKYEKWDGSLLNGISAPAGYYMYYINYTTLTETNVILTGHIELLR